MPFVTAPSPSALNDECDYLGHAYLNVSPNTETITEPRYADYSLRGAGTLQSLRGLKPVRKGATKLSKNCDTP